MNSCTHPDITTDIIEKVKAFGASLAGIAGIELLKNSPSFEIYDKSPYYDGYKKVNSPKDVKSVLVIAFVHELSDLVNEIPSVRCLESPRTRSRSSMSVCRVYRAESSRGLLNGEALAGRATHAV